MLIFRAQAWLVPAFRIPGATAPAHAWIVTSTESGGGGFLALPGYFLDEDTAWALAWWLTMHQAEA